MAIETGRLYTIKEASDLLSISTASMKEKCHKGDIECSNIGTDDRKIFRIEGGSILNFLDT